MCIICAKPRGVAMPDMSTIETMWENNSDGAGIMYTHNGKVIIDKGYMKLAGFKKALKDIEAEVDLFNEAAVLHFRIGTAGGNIPANTHPFPISDSIGALKKLHLEVSLGVVHNGIIPIVTRTKDISDTMEYIAAQLAPLRRAFPKFYTNEHLMTLIKNAIGSRMTFLDSAGSLYTVGEFVEDNGLLYSNSTYKTTRYYRNVYGRVYTGYNDYRWLHDEEQDAFGLPMPATYHVRMMWLEDSGYLITSDGKYLFNAIYTMDDLYRVYWFNVDDGVCTLIPGATAYHSNGSTVQYDAKESELLPVLCSLSYDPSKQAVSPESLSTKTTPATSASSAASSAVTLSRTNIIPHLEPTKIK